MSGFDRFFPFAVWSVYFFSKQRKVTTNIYVYVSIRVLIYLLASFHVRVLIKCLDINDRWRGLTRRKNPRQFDEKWKWRWKSCVPLPARSQQKYSRCLFHISLLFSRIIDFLPFLLCLIPILALMWDEERTELCMVPGFRGIRVMPILSGESLSGRQLRTSVMPQVSWLRTSLRFLLISFTPLKWDIHRHVA